MSVLDRGQRMMLLQVARRAMIERGLAPDFPSEAMAEATRLTAPAPPFGSGVRDLRDLAWCSIDNDDSRDLDQLTVAAPLDGDRARVSIAVADVRSSVAPGSPIDAHASANTTSVYTPPQVFPMLPERLSTDLTSLGQDVDRLAIVIEIIVDGAGSGGESNVYSAVVRNHAKLAYSSIGAWLEGKGPMPGPIGAVPGLADNLRLQERVAQRLRAFRHEHGALELESLESRPRIEDDTVVGLEKEVPNRAKEIIEDFMIAANGAIAQFLAQRKFPIMRRVVRSPERWQRIVDVAQHLGERLPSEPDPKALQEFLLRRRAADALRFPDLSLTVIKLLGRGEYVASFPGQDTIGHFGLAVSDYTHSTAPNRRYPDLITQRLIVAALAGQSPPYSPPELAALAAHCTEKEDAAQRVERQARKSAAACLMSDRIGSEFDGIVTGASDKGTWARVFDPPVEGRIEQSQQGLDVGDQVRVKLLRADPEHGFIDFARVAQVAVEQRSNPR